MTFLGSAVIKSDVLPKGGTKSLVVLCALPLEHSGRGRIPYRRRNYNEDSGGDAVDWRQRVEVQWMAGSRTR